MELEKVFNRRITNSNDKILSPNMYNLAIGLTLCWGFFVNYIVVKSVPVEAIASIGMMPFFILYIICCFAGVMMYAKSDNPLISFIGYNLVVIPFGFIINIAVSMFDPTIVVKAIQTTGLVTLAMMILGTMFPAFFSRIQRALTISLLVVIIVEVFNMFILGIDQNLIDWIVVFIFCGYIGYDWGRANAIPKTLDNAIDSAASLYMDIINLFLRLLSIFGRRE